MANLRITEILLAALTWLIQEKSESIDYTPDVADPTVVTYRTFKKKRGWHQNLLIFEAPLPWFELMIPHRPHPLVSSPLLHLIYL